MTDYLSVTLRVVDAMSAPLRSITDRMQAMARACTTVQTASERLATPFHDARLAASDFISAADNIPDVSASIDASSYIRATDAVRSAADAISNMPVFRADASPIAKATEQAHAFSEAVQNAPSLRVDADTSQIAKAEEQIESLSSELRSVPTVRTKADISPISRMSGLISRLSEAVRRIPDISLGINTAPLAGAMRTVRSLSSIVRNLRTVRLNVDASPLSRLVNFAKKLNEHFRNAAKVHLPEMNSKINDTNSKINDTDQAITMTSYKLSIVAYSMQAVFFVSRLISSAWSKIVNTVSKLLSYSDAVTQTMARINIAGDAQYSADQIMSAAYNAAVRSRSDYLATADAVSKLMVRAPDAFNGAGEAVQFAENLNKLFRIAGATTEEQNSATLQLTQALGSGVLRGEEFNAVFEAAPNIMRTIADSMGVPIGSLREMAANGEITAEVVKNALLGATDSIDAEFRKIPRTWESVVTSLSTTYERAFQKLQTSINRILNTSSFDRIMDSIGNGIILVSEYVSRMADTIADGLNSITSSKGFDVFISDVTTGLFGVMKALTWAVSAIVRGADLIISRWREVRIALIFIVPVVSALVATLVALKAATLASATATGISTAAMAVHSVMMGTATTATNSLVGSQLALNLAMYACPLLWVVVGLAAVVAGIYAVVYAYNELTGSTVSATGLILGSLAGLGAYAYNQFALIYNSLAGLKELLLNLFTHPIYAAQRNIANLVQFAVSQFSFLAEAIDKLTGSDIASQMQGLSDRMNAQLVATMPDDYKTVSRLEYANVADELSNGYYLSDALSGLNVSSLMGIDLETGNIESTLSKIEANTASAASSLEMSKDEIGYMRMIADNRTISNNSISSVKIDMTNNNSISNGYDSDVFVSNLVESLDKSYRSSARGIHS